MLQEKEYEMKAGLQFQKDANVLAANGKQLGHIDRVVLNPETKEVTHIVVRKGALFTQEERVVPIDMVARTTRAEIDLRDEAGDLKSSPAFEERRIVGEDVDAPPASPVMYGTPMMGASLPPDPADRFVTQIEQNIPEGTVALKEGATVITAEGKHVGRVEQVRADLPADRATHLLVSAGLFTKETKLIPITWVKMIDENEVHLRVESDALDKLADASVGVEGK
jgi:sporulation protein YlmC with PRC-barrel domain